MQVLPSAFAFRTPTPCAFASTSVVCASCGKLPPIVLHLNLFEFKVSPRKPCTMTVPLIPHTLPTTFIFIFKDCHADRKWTACFAPPTSRLNFISSRYGCQGSSWVADYISMVQNPKVRLPCLCTRSDFKSSYLQIQYWLLHSIMLEKYLLELVGTSIESLLLRTRSLKLTWPRHENFMSPH